MSLAIVYSRAGIGIEAPLVTVEVHLSNGLPSLSIVGLPEAAVKESKHRVRSAIINSNFEIYFPMHFLSSDNENIYNLTFGIFHFRLSFELWDIEFWISFIFGRKTEKILHKNN